MVSSLHLQVWGTAVPGLRKKTMEASILLPSLRASVSCPPDRWPFEALRATFLVTVAILWAWPSCLNLSQQSTEVPAAFRAWKQQEGQ